MEKFPLCKFCLARFKKKKSAVQQSSSFEWNTFSVSTSFQKSVLAKGEKVADYFAPGDFSALKNSVNAEAIAAIASETGKKNSQRFADAIFSLDFISKTSKAVPTPVYIFGRYQKLSRKHCQSRWHCSECGGKGCDSCGGSGQNYPAVEEEIGRVLQPLFGASAATLHASGREDVDVRMLGNGRPFVMELKNTKKRSADLREAEAAFASKPSVRALGLKMAPPNFLVAVVNPHFEKEYSALVAANRPLTKQDAAKAASLSGTMLFQQTPNRALGRRADLGRRCKVLNISAAQVPRGMLRLQILAEAGTYIKELISGDEGRTKTSLSSLLGCRAACEELDVVRIHDYFLETLKPD